MVCPTAKPVTPFFSSTAEALSSFVQVLGYRATFVADQVVDWKNDFSASSAKGKKIYCATLPHAQVDHTQPNLLKKIVPSILRGGKTKAAEDTGDLPA